MWFMNCSRPTLRGDDHAQGCQRLCCAACSPKGGNNTVRPVQERKLKGSGSVREFTHTEERGTTCMATPTRPPAFWVLTTHSIGLSNSQSLRTCSPGLGGLML